MLLCMLFFAVILCSKHMPAYELRMSDWSSDVFSSDLFAFQKRVLLATTTNLIAIARTVAAVWRQEKLASEVKAIGALGKEMYDRLAVVSGHLRTVGTGQIGRAHV